MNQINIQFPDGNTKEFDKGTTTEDIAQSISPGLRKKAVAGKFNCFYNFCQSNNKVTIKF